MLYHLTIGLHLNGARRDDSPGNPGVNGPEAKSSHQQPKRRDSRCQRQARTPARRLGMCFPQQDPFCGAGHRGAPESRSCPASKDWSGDCGRWMGSTNIRRPRPIRVPGVRGDDTESRCVFFSTTSRGPSAAMAPPSSTSRVVAFGNRQWLMGHDDHGAALRLQFAHGGIEGFGAFVVQG
jgi:hypothetical protein